MTEIYLYTFGVHPQFQAHSSHNPWKFLSVESDKGLLHLNEATLEST